jgi:hypothetical protein
MKWMGWDLYGLMIAPPQYLVKILELIKEEQEENGNRSRD